MQVCKMACHPKTFIVCNELSKINRNLKKENRKGRESGPKTHEPSPHVHSLIIPSSAYIWGKVHVEDGEYFILFTHVHNGRHMVARLRVDHHGGGTICICDVADNKMVPALSFKTESAAVDIS
eukprot:Phypoly_transcript_17457.p2 GENE.Phypoly_transcript_17457~~Phypoly_transcript_17457.p2  ORF type:complete len:123 (+),score=14.86 Phypoly_transcript_17457:174-542(+)